MSDAVISATVDKAMIEARMCSGEPFTFIGLWSLPGLGDGGYRTADKIIQQWRRAGRIVFHRQGRDTVWTLTEAGRAHVGKLRTDARRASVTP